MRALVCACAPQLQEGQSADHPTVVDLESSHIRGAFNLEVGIGVLTWNHNGSRARAGVVGTLLFLGSA